MSFYETFFYLGSKLLHIASCQCEHKPFYYKAILFILNQILFLLVPYQGGFRR